MSTQVVPAQATPAAAVPVRKDEGPGAGYAGALVIVFVGLALVGSLLLLVHGLVAFWPQPDATVAAGGLGSDLRAEPLPPASFLFWSLNVSREARLFAVVAFAGALGGTIHGLRSLSWYAGNRDLRMSWLPSYVLYPFVGAGMGLLLYIVLRAGLFSPQGGSETLSPYGFAAVAGLIGLFSEQGASKLKDVFEVLFTNAPRGKESTERLELKSFEPASGKVGSKVTIRGAGFNNETTVQFNGSETVAKFVSNKELIAQVPLGAQTGPLSIVRGGDAVKSTTNFEVTA